MGERKGKARFDTYEIDNPGKPMGTYAEAYERKQELVKQGYRVKLRKDADGAWVVFRKNDKLFHNNKGS
jgi:hypothetical protein